MTTTLAVVAFFAVVILLGTILLPGSPKEKNKV